MRCLPRRLGHQVLRQHRVLIRIGVLTLLPCEPGRTRQVGALEVGLAKLGTRKDSVLQVGAPQNGFLEHCLTQIGPTQVGVFEVAALQVCLPQVRTAQVCPTQVGTRQVRPIEPRALEVRLRERRALQVYLAQRRARQPRLSQVGPLQYRARGVGLLQVRFTEISLFQMHPGEECSLQVRFTEVGFLEMCFLQGHFFQVGPNQLSLLQVRPTQVGSCQQHCRGSALFFSGFIPLFACEAAMQIRQWEPVQVYITQVRTPQVQPLAILLLVAASREITSVFAPCQEPLDIGTTQFHPFKGIDASSDIRGRRETAHQLFLTCYLDLTSRRLLLYGCLIGTPCCPVWSRGGDDTPSQCTL